MGLTPRFKINRRQYAQRAKRNKLDLHPVPEIHLAQQAQKEMRERVNK